ncbi:MAG: hypothetical protein ACYTGP_03615 [Planctomycetota bacterium]|jgi:hypothetical protein
MSRFGSQYQVSRSTGVCAATGEPLEPGGECVATLCEQSEGEGFDRQDFSVEAWEAGERPERLFSFWRTTVPVPGEKRKLLVDDSVLMDLFERLADDERPQRKAFRFVLALILMRKRLLRFVGRAEARDDAPGRWKLRPKGADPESPPLEVEDPGLTDEDVRELTAQLGEVLQGEL